MTAPSLNCDFCAEFSKKLPSTFDQIYCGDPAARVLFRTYDFVLVPSLGQIAEGHLLLLPIKHSTALADLHERLFAEFRKTLSFVTTVFKMKYGSYVMFEHGVRLGGRGGCGVSHAHLHILPLSAALDPVDLLKSSFAYKELKALADIKDQSRGMSSYLLYQDSESKMFLFETPNLASQYMRRLVAQALGTPRWDWRSAGREQKLIATLNRLSGCFERPSPLARTVCK